MEWDWEIVPYSGDFVLLGCYVRVVLHMFNCNFDGLKDIIWLTYHTTCNWFLIKLLTGDEPYCNRYDVTIRFISFIF